jgi:hypothetical protein
MTHLLPFDKEALEKALAPLKITPDQLAVLNTHDLQLSVDIYGQVWLFVPECGFFRIRMLAATELLRGRYSVTFDKAVLQEHQNYIGGLFPRPYFHLQTLFDEMNQWSKSFAVWLSQR